MYSLPFHSFIYSFIQSSVHSTTYPSRHPFIILVSRLSIHSFIHLFILLIHPSSRRLIDPSIHSLIQLCINSLIHPSILLFLHTVSSLLWLFCYGVVFVTVAFIRQIYFNFHTVYLSDMGELITEPRKLALHYAKGRFPFDFVASFPIDLFALAAPTGTKLEILSYLRMLHLLRLVRIQQFFSDLGKRLNVE